MTLTPAAMNTMTGSLVDTTVADEIKVTSMASSSTIDNLPSVTHLKQNKSRHFEECFPTKLYKMLETAGSLGLSAAVSWHPHGRAFIIKDKELFMTQLFPMFCKATKYRSFQRQCGLWGFHRIPSGRNTEAWWHESFVLGRPEDLKYIVRSRLKSMVPNIRHLPKPYDNMAYTCKKLPAMDGKVDDIPLVSANRRSDRDKEFENLDVEFEAFLRERALIHVTKTHPRRVSTAVYSVPDLLNSEYGSHSGRNYSLGQEEQNLSPTLVASDRVAVLSSNMGQTCGDQAFPCCNNLVSSPQQDAIVHQPGRVPMKPVRDDVASAQAMADEVEWNELSNLVDQMIQQLP